MQSKQLMLMQLMPRQLKLLLQPTQSSHLGFHLSMFQEGLILGMFLYSLVQEGLPFGMFLESLLQEGLHLGSQSQGLGELTMTASTKDLSTVSTVNLCVTPATMDLVLTNHPTWPPPLVLRPT